jgi:hypothetical protein
MLHLNSTKAYWLMLFKERITDCTEKHMKSMNKNAALLTVEAEGVYI